MSNAIISELIELAWADDVTFESIQRQSGLTERDMIRLMKHHLKPRSYELWRERVTGRTRKHERRNLHNRNN